MMTEILINEPLLLIGLIALVGFYAGGLARRVRLPSLIGFMLLGVLIGPSCLGWLDQTRVESFSFLTEIALGFVAFSIGAELSMHSLRQLGKGIVSIIFAESFCAFFITMFGVYLVTRSWPMALLFGAVAPASAPAGTVAVIQENRAKGPLTKALYAVVGFDDGLGILIFGFAAALAKTLLMSELGLNTAGEGLLTAMKLPAVEVLTSLGIGAVLGFLFCLFVRKLDAPRDMLIMIAGTVLLATGLSEHFHLSLILTNMVIGFVLVNTRREAFVHKVTAPLHDVMPLFFLLFFSLAGAHLEIATLPRLGAIGIVYLFCRTGGLIGGAWLGALLGHVQAVVKKYVGLGILSQAGVAIGLSLVVQKDFSELMNRPEVLTAVQTYGQAHPQTAALLYNPAAIAAALITSITATCIVFEIVGPILTKIALTKAGEINARDA